MFQVSILSFKFINSVELHNLCIVMSKRKSLFHIFYLELVIIVFLFRIINFHFSYHWGSSFTFIICVHNVFVVFMYLLGDGGLMLCYFFNNFSIAFVKIQYCISDKGKTIRCNAIIPAN